MGDIRGPDGDMISFLDPHAKKALSDTIGQCVEFAISQTQTAIRINQGVMLGETAGDIGKQGAHSESERLCHIETSIF